jgi:hypothetical protein
MVLLEKSEIILEAGESVLRQGECVTEISKALLRNLQDVLLWPRYWHHFPRGPLGHMVESRKRVKGELVLTNKRLILLGEKGRIRKKIIPYLELDLKKISEVSVKSLEKGEKLVVSLDLGGMEPWELEFQLIGATGWVDIIKRHAGTSAIG